VHNRSRARIARFRARSSLCTRRGRPGYQPRSPARLASTGADPLLQLRGKKPRRAKRTARAVNQSLGPTPAIKPALPPAVRRRRRDAEGGRGRPQRQTLLDPAPPARAGQPIRAWRWPVEHPRPPLSVSPGRPTASKEGRIEPSAVHNVCRHVSLVRGRRSEFAKVVDLLVLLRRARPARACRAPNSDSALHRGFGALRGQVALQPADLPCGAGLSSSHVLSFSDARRHRRVRE
jgi:hypothetical protein